MKRIKIVWQFLMVPVALFIFTSCAPQPPSVQFVRQKIPIAIQEGKSLTVEIQSLSGNGVNDVGIRCSPETWSVLTNSPNAIRVRLKSSNKPRTEIGGVMPGSDGTGFLPLVPNVHYLFYISGQYHAKASVEITFPNAPEGVTSAEIIVGKTPADTGL